MMRAGYVPQQRAARDVLGRRWVFAVLVAIHAFLTIYAYRDVIAANFYFARTGFFAYPTDFWGVAPSVAISLIPLAWLRHEIKTAADLCVLYLYIFVFVPSCVLMPYISTLSEGRQIVLLTGLLAAFGAVELRRFIPKMEIPRITLGGDQTLDIVLIGSAVIALLIFYFTESIELDNISLFDVYDQRARFFADGSFSRVIVGYVGNWLAGAVAPIMIVLGLHRRRYVFASLGLLVAVLAFLATSFKSHFFVPIMIGGVYFVLKTLGAKRGGLTLIMLALVIGGVSVAYDKAYSTLPVVTWTLQFRFVGNNGFLTVQYFNFFENMPLGFYADSIGRFIVDPAYNVPIAQMVGESFSQTRGNHANANVWADGYGNLGLAGLAFATAELIAFLWLVDSVTDRKNIYVVAPILLSAAFALSNTQVHSMLTSNGGVLLLVLLAMLPRDADVSAGTTDDA